MDFIYDLYQLITDAIMHIPLAFVRRFYGKMVFKKMGRGVQLSRHIHLISPHKIEIGDNVFINRHVTLDGRKGLFVADNVDVGEYSSIWSLQHDYNDQEHSTVGGLTTIKDHVWIAPHSIILPGRIIERGCVVATHSVVTKNTPPKSIVAGIPAKVIGERKNDLIYQLKYRIYF